jgi:hypothetical protein
MSNSVQTEFDQILTAAKERRGDLAVDSMIVSSHLAQMRMFMLRRGLEFFAEQDSYGKRREFISQVCEHNMLDMKLDSIVDYFLCDGQGLFYFRPTGDDYQLLYFPKDSYRAYRDQNNELESIVLVYSFGVKQAATLGAYDNVGPRGGKKKYIRLKVYKDRIEQTISDEKIEFDNENGSLPFNMPGATETLTNSLGFIPAVEVFNHMDCTGEATGNGEFDWLSNQILYHDELVRNIRKNLKFFGNPTLVSSRPRHDLIEAGDESGFKPTISSQAGFAPMTGGAMHSTSRTPPIGTRASDGQIKVPRIIANLEPTDRVQYMTPDSVSGDQNLYVKSYRSEIRLALGGVDDLDIGTAGTAYEIKTLYGRVAATAEKKAKGLFTYGLCKLFALMISHEEKMFHESFAAAIGLIKPEIPLPEEFQGDEEAFGKAMEKYNKQMQKFIQEREENIRATLESGEMPPGVIGLIPDGNTKVAWRWMGEVFEEGTDDILNNSIVVRNLQELGVDSIEALKYLFPNKTDEERAAMLSGYPFRMVQQTQQSLNSFIGLLGSLYQLPHPQTPDLPLASDPNLDITGFLYRSLEFLRKELSYSGSYKPSDSSTAPDKLSDADERRIRLGIPIRDESAPSLAGLSGPGSSPGTTIPGTNLPAAGGPASFGTPGQSMAGGVPGAQRKFEYKQPLPNPGSVLGLPDTDASGFSTSQLGFNSPSNVGSFGAADLQSPSFNPGLLNRPGANAGRNANAASGTGSSKRRVSKSDQRRKS